jgi:hypothetical protein
MNVRAKKIAAAHKVIGGQPTPKPMAAPYTFPAPVRGWVLNDPLASAGQGGAKILDNWICTQNSVRVRGGCVKIATLPEAPVSLFSYRTATPRRFAATAAGIYDFTTVVDPEVALTAAVGSLTSGDFSTIQFGTAGGDFLIAVNGADDMQLYDGSTWTAINGASSPAITGVSTSDLSHVWAHGSRVWFVGSGTLSAWYLPVDSVAGAATEFSLAGIFTKGGSLLFGAKWSLGAGDGLDDKCVFVSTEGEVAIYEGTNPGSASTWRLAGVYTLPRPMGKRGYESAGGDLLVTTESGLIPVSAAINTDLGAIETKAVSRQIADYWTSQADSIVGGGWEVIKVPASGVMVVSLPVATGLDRNCLAVNLVTGSWSRITGWDTQCLLEFGGQGFFGSVDACIYQMDASGSDAGEIYTATYLGLHEPMNAPGAEKTILQMRPIFRLGSPANPQLTVSADFDEQIPAPPSSIAEYTSDTWDSGLWDTAVWDAATAYSVNPLWYPVAGSGTFIAPLLQLSFGVTPTPRVELVSIDAQIEAGAMVA